MWTEMFLLLFVFFTIAHLNSEVFKNARVRYLTKPALMPLLASYYMATAETDILNAFGKFVREIPNERFYTMITYLAGQFLLVQGYLLF